MGKRENNANNPYWLVKGSLNEVFFCEDFLYQHPMVRVGGSFFTREERVPDDESVRKMIYDMLRPYLNKGLAKLSTGLL